MFFLLECRVVRILWVCYEHVSGSMSYRKGRFAVHHYGLGSHSASPEYRNFTLSYFYRVSELRPVYILNSYCCRISNMHGSSMNCRETSGAKRGLTTCECLTGLMLTTVGPLKRPAGWHCMFVIYIERCNRIPCA